MGEAATGRLQPVPPGIMRTPIARALLFIPGYVALDWASYFYPFGPFYITPWNPQPALAVVLVMLFGARYFPAVATAIFIADLLLRNAPAGYGLSLLAALGLAAGYCAIGEVLRLVIKDASLRRLRDLAVFCGVVAAGTALISSAYVGLLNTIAPESAFQAVRSALQFWVGDLVGILVTAPLLLMAADARRRTTLGKIVRSGQAWLQYAVMGAMLWAIFGVYHDDAARLFYLLFIPLIWTALRWGMPGAMIAATIAQVGVLLGMHGRGTPISILELQALVAAFTMMGLFLGVMSDERAESEDRLRQSLRLAAAGEMAGAIAHELNQPLTALAVYSESAVAMLQRGGDPAAQQPILEKMVREVKRAAEVIRRLRDLFDSGTTHLERVEVDELLETARRMAHRVIAGAPIDLHVANGGGLPPLLVDRLQIELVLRNLVANSVESLVSSTRRDGQIRIVAEKTDGGMVRILVADNGPGIPAATRERLFEPFVSGKAMGMGLGLSVSRAIAEAHGGSLETGPREQTEFHLFLPCAETT